MQKPKMYYLGAIKQNAVIVASFLTRVVMNTLFPASGYQIALAICKDCVVEYYETVEQLITIQKLVDICKILKYGLLITLFVNLVEELCPQCTLS